MGEKLRIGIIGKAHGVKGEVKLYPTTNELSIILSLNDCFIKNKNNSSYIKYNIKNIKSKNDFFITKFDEINDRNDALSFTGSEVYIDRDEIKELSEDEFFYKDIIGLSVITDTDRLLGKVTSIYETGANDVYKVTGEKEILLPAIKDVIKKIDIKNKQIIVHLLDGLEELNN